MRKRTTKTDSLRQNRSEKKRPRIRGASAFKDRRGLRLREELFQKKLCVSRAALPKRRFCAQKPPLRTRRATTSRRLRGAPFLHAPAGHRRPERFSKNTGFPRLPAMPAPEGTPQLSLYAGDASATACPSTGSMNHPVLMGRPGLRPLPASRLQIPLRTWGAPRIMPRDADAEKIPCACRVPRLRHFQTTFPQKNLRMRGAPFLHAPAGHRRPDSSMQPTMTCLALRGHAAFSGIGKKRRPAMGGPFRKKTVFPIY